MNKIAFRAFLLILFVSIIVLLMVSRSFLDLPIEPAQEVEEGLSGPNKKDERETSEVVVLPKETVETTATPAPIPPKKEAVHGKVVVNQAGEQVKSERVRRMLKNFGVDMEDLKAGQGISVEFELDPSGNVRHISRSTARSDSKMSKKAPNRERNQKKREAFPEVELTEDEKQAFLEELPPALSENDEALDPSASGNTNQQEVSASGNANEGDDQQKSDSFEDELLKQLMSYKELGEKYAQDPNAWAYRNLIPAEDHRWLFDEGVVSSLSKVLLPSDVIDALMGKSVKGGEYLNRLKGQAHMARLITEATLHMDAASAFDTFSTKSSGGFKVLKEVMNNISRRLHKEVGLRLTLEKSMAIEWRSLRQEVISDLLNDPSLSPREAMEEIFLLDKLLVNVKQLMGKTMKRWMLKDKKASLAYFEEQSLRFTGDEISSILNYWNSQEGFNQSTIESIYTKEFNSLVTTQPAKAAELFDRLSSIKSFHPPLDRLIYSWGRRDRPAFVEWMLKNTGKDDERYDMLLKGTFTNWAQSNFSDTLALAHKLSQREDVSEKTKAYFYSNIAKVASYRSNDKRSHLWIGELPEGLIRDRSILLYALGFARRFDDAQLELKLKKMLWLAEVKIEDVKEHMVGATIPSEPIAKVEELLAVE